MIGKLAAVGALLIAAGLWAVLAWPTSAPEPPEADPAPEAPAAGPPPSAAESAALAAPATADAPRPATPAAEATAPPAVPEDPVPAPAASGDDPIQSDQGPVDEYRKRFESEPRDRIAPEYEKHISGAFAAASAAPDLFKSVLCRETICRVELRWSKDRQRSYMQAITRLGIGGRHGHVPESKYSFTMPLALSPVGQPDADGTRLVELYVKRNPPGTRAVPLPSHEH